MRSSKEMKVKVSVNTICEDPCGGGHMSQRLSLTLENKTSMENSIFQLDKAHSSCSLSVLDYQLFIKRSHGP